MRSKADRTKYAQGSLAGLVAGDSLGSQVEFMEAERIAEKYPSGIHQMIGSSIWRSLPGQGTDDTELAITLTRSIIDCEGYDPNHTFYAYREWLQSIPFSWGHSMVAALLNRPNSKSLGNGALMRCAPIGIYGAGTRSR